MKYGETYLGYTLYVRGRTVIKLWFDSLKEAIKAKDELFENNHILSDSYGTEANIVQEIWITDCNKCGPYCSMEDSIEVWENNMTGKDGHFNEVATNEDQAWYLVQEIYNNDIRHLIYKNYMKEDFTNIDIFWEWWDSLERDDKIYVVNHPEGDII